MEEKRWYSLRVISGKEKKIKERMELEIQRSGWGDFVTQILVPSEKVYKIRNGKKVIMERNILPVIHFLGKNKPIPMQPSEANRMLGKVDDSQDLVEAMIEPLWVISKM